jgi:hypothetical protein
VKSSVAISSDGNGVSWPIALAIIWSMVVSLRTSTPSVFLGEMPVSHIAGAVAWPPAAGSFGPSRPLTTHT